MIHPSFPFIFNPRLLTCSSSTPILMQILANPRGSSSQLCHGLDLCYAGINLWTIGVGRSTGSTGNLGNWEERLSARVIAGSGHKVIGWRRWQAWHSNLNPCPLLPQAWHSTAHTPVLCPCEPDTAWSIPCPLPPPAWYSTALMSLHSAVHTAVLCPCHPDIVWPTPLSSAPASMTQRTPHPCPLCPRHTSVTQCSPHGYPLLLRVWHSTVHTITSEIIWWLDLSAWFISLIKSL